MKSTHQIIDFIQSNPGAKSGEIRRALKLKEHTLSYELRYLVREGIIFRKGVAGQFEYFPQPPKVTSIPTRRGCMNPMTVMFNNLLREVKEARA